jgi:hypothetical protein
MKIAKDRGRKPTEKKLKEAFKEIKEDGSIVGDEWPEKDK